MAETSFRETKTELKARERGLHRRGIRFGDVKLRYGPRGWYVKGYSRLGHKPTLEEIKEAVQLLAIEAIMEQMVEDGILERVS
jgi:hypothetical protein